MCLGTFSRRGAVASATIYPCAECASSQSVFVPNALRRNLLRRRKQSVLHNHFFGHFSAQIPQPLQVSGSIFARKSVTFAAPTGSVSLTECTADTTCAALLHRHRTFCLGATCHQILCIVRNQRNQVLRTCCDTFSTCLAGFLIDNCYAVYDMDCVEGTCLYAVTETGTTIITGFRTSVWDKGKHRTVGDSMILIICLRLIAGSLTGYKCNLFSSLFPLLRP